MRGKNLEPRIKLAALPMAFSNRPSEKWVTRSHSASFRDIKFLRRKCEHLRSPLRAAAGIPIEAAPYAGGPAGRDIDGFR